MLDNQLNPADQQLLTAVLGEGDQAIQAWRAWRVSIDFEQADTRYTPLIPLLQQNLTRLGIQDPLAGRFNGIHRRVFYKNQLLLHQVSTVLQAWQANGLTPLCLTDLALASHYYANLGLRPIRTVQFLLHPTQIEAARHALQANGWQPEQRLPPRRFQRFLNLEGTKIDLYTQLFPPSLYAGHPELFWADKLRIQIQAVSTYALQPTDQLLVLCTLPPQKQFAHLLWIADALTLLRQPTIAIDWPRLSTIHLGPQLRLRLHAALLYLATTYAAPIPAEVITGLASAPPLLHRWRRALWRFFFTK